MGETDSGGSVSGDLFHNSVSAGKGTSGFRIIVLALTQSGCPEGPL